MKKMVRKNQIIITALAVMIVVAGYLNFTGQDITTGSFSGGKVTKQEANKKETEPETSASAEETSGTEDTDKKQEEAADQQANATDISEEGQESSDYMVSDNGEVVSSKESPGEAVMVSNTIGADYFSSAKLSREQTRAKNKETLMEIVNNKNLSSSDKKAAVDEVAQITEAAGKESAAEMMLEAKGFEEVMVSINENGADVVVDAEELTSQQMTQIVDIVKRQTGIAASKIVITPVSVEETK